MSTHPRMMYRSGTSLEWEGHSLDTRIVTDEDEEAKAVKEGWRISPLPLDHDGDNKPGGSLPGSKSTRSKGRRKKKVSK